MLNRNSGHHNSLAPTPNGSRRSATGRRLAASATARRFVCACAFFVLSTLLGCGAAGNGPSTAAVDANIAVDPVFLTPGLTSATLDWPASDGNVDSYIVFESRNGSLFRYSNSTNQPEIQISGEAGDRVQVTVVAVNSNGDMSEASPPSPPVVFQAATQTAAARAVTLGGGSMAPTATLDSSEQALTEAADANDAATESDRPESDTNSAEEDASTEPLARLAQSVRALLLGGDTRLPEAGLTSEARGWLQTHVDAEMVAGVSLAGTGRSNTDDLREIVWRDQSGQLFLSDGAAALETDDLPATFEEALRLRTTERFVGLADFDGDGHGDWLIEDTATGESWIVNGESTAVSPTTGNADALLAGHGDFDGDGRSELLWRTEQGVLSLTRPGDLSENFVPLDIAPEGFALLAVADFDGDGRDDLLGRGANGGLILAMTPAPELESGPVALEWRTGSQDSSEALELVATVDVDEDGAAEIAWLNGDTVEIWNAESGLESQIAL